LENIAVKFIPINIHIDNCFNKKSMEVHLIPGYTIVVTFINKNIIEIKKDSRTFEPHKLNSNSPNCQLKDNMK